MSVYAFARALGAGAFALAASFSAASAQDKVVYQLDWLPGGDKAPIYICINRGFCKEAGLDVSIASGRGSTEAITKLAHRLVRHRLRGHGGPDGGQGAREGAGRRRHVDLQQGTARLLHPQGQRRRTK